MANYSKEWSISSMTHRQILKAMQCLDGGLGVTKTAERFNVSVSTINKLRKKALAARENGKPVDWKKGY